jgi:hypothetical protein
MCRVIVIVVFTCEVKAAGKFVGMESGINMNYLDLKGRP